MTTYRVTTATVTCTCCTAFWFLTAVALALGLGIPLSRRHDDVADSTPLSEVAVRSMCHRAYDRPGITYLAACLEFATAALSANVSTCSRCYSTSLRESGYNVACQYFSFSYFLNPSSTCYGRAMSACDSYRQDPFCVHDAQLSTATSCGPDTIFKTLQTCIVPVGLTRAEEYQLASSGRVRFLPTSVKVNDTACTATSASPCCRMPLPHRVTLQLYKNSLNYYMLGVAYGDAASAQISVRAVAASNNGLYESSCVGAQDFVKLLRFSETLYCRSILNSCVVSSDTRIFFSDPGTDPTGDSNIVYFIGFDTCSIAGNGTAVAAV